MAKRGRKALLTPTVEWKCRIPLPIAAKIDLLTLDPVTGAPAYGARSELVTRLLREYLDKLGVKMENGNSGDVNS